MTEFLALTVLLTFAATVTGLLLAGVVRYVVVTDRARGRRHAPYGRPARRDRQAREVPAE